MKNILNYIDDYFEENLEEQLTNRNFKRNKLNVSKKMCSKHHNCKCDHNKCSEEE